MLAAGALTAIAITPVAITQPASAARPPTVAAPTDRPDAVTNTGAFALPALALSGPPARQGLGSVPTLERATQAVSRSLTRRTTQFRHVAIRAVAVQHKIGYTGRHRAQPAVVHRTIRRAVTSRRSPPRSYGRGRAAIVAYARAHLGAAYVSNAAGPRSFDCSGLTMRAYAAAGISLPHSSGAQAARARTVSRAQALPGDLVVGPGHVGIYMGGGMMIDAGNPRVDVSYRPMYAGLHIEELI